MHRNSVMLNSDAYLELKHALAAALSESTHGKEKVGIVQAELRVSGVAHVAIGGDADVPLAVVLNSVDLVTAFKIGRRPVVVPDVPEGSPYGVFVSIGARGNDGHLRVRNGLAAFPENIPG